MYSNRKTENPINETTNQEQIALDVNYDPFGVHKAAIEAQTSVPLIVSLAARVVLGALIFIGFLPFVLLVILSVYSHVSFSYTVFYITVILWLWMILFFAIQFRFMKARRKTLSTPTIGKHGNVVVIGAGPVGLAVIKECLKQGLEVECFEKNNGLGGRFRFDKNQPHGLCQNSRLTSSPWITAFSDFPPADVSSNQYKHNEYLNYLEAYADKFKLRHIINFGHIVENIKSSAEGWQVTVHEKISLKKYVVKCSHVAVCSGIYEPKPAYIPGSNIFTGIIRHISSYRGVEDCKGKNVVVVGIGESGADIAYEISSVAKRTFLSIHRGKFVIPRINPLTRRASDYDTNRLRYGLPGCLRDWFMLFKRKLCKYIGNHTTESAIRAQLLYLSGTGPTSQAATKSDDFIKPLIDGRLILTPEIVRFDNNAVILSDGRRVAADLVYFANGYRHKFPFLELPIKVNVRNPGQLYLKMFYPEIGGSLAFCGFARPALGAIPPTGEMQARFFSLIASGQRTLPGKTEMLNDIETDQRINTERFPLLPKEHHVVSWIPYMDKLADCIGCRPNPWQLLFSSPTLLWKLATGPYNGAQYRLHGEGRNTNLAIQIINSLPRDHQFHEIVILFGLHFWLWPIMLLFGKKIGCCSREYI